MNEAVLFLLGYTLCGAAVGFLWTKIASARRKRIRDQTTSLALREILPEILEMAEVALKHDLPLKVRLLIIYLVAELQKPEGRRANCRRRSTPQPPHDSRNGPSLLEEFDRLRGENLAAYNDVVRALTSLFWMHQQLTGEAPKGVTSPSPPVVWEREVLLRAGNFEPSIMAASLQAA